MDPTTVAAVCSAVIALAVLGGQILSYLQGRSIKTAVQDTQKTAVSTHELVNGQSEKVNMLTGQLGLKTGELIGRDFQTPTIPIAKDPINQ